MNLIAKLLMNSLYGKFGMKPEFTSVSVFDQTDEEDKAITEEILEYNGESIQDHITVGNHLIMVKTNVPGYTHDESEDLYHGLDVSIAVAATITSGARILMSKVKNQSDFDLYYTDTDSIIINKPLPSTLVGSALGQFKLEYEIKEAVFLAPKVYGFRTTDDKSIIKIKGVSSEAMSNLSVADLAKLLVKDSTLMIKQSKWYKDIYKGDISVLETAYQLKATSNKRRPIYNLYNVESSTSDMEFTMLDYTMPYNYSEIEKQYI